MEKADFYKNMFKDDNFLEQCLNINATLIKRRKALSKRVETVKVAVKNNDVKKALDVIGLDTKSFTETIDNLSETEREQVLADARQHAKIQQARIQQFAKAENKSVSAFCINKILGE